MKRHLLFIGFDEAYQSEISEFLEERNGHAWFSTSIDRSIRLLDEYHPEAVVLNLLRLGDAAILKYLSEYYPEIKVLVSASDEFESVLKVLKNTQYSLVHQPFKLKELMNLLESY